MARMPSGAPRSVPDPDGDKYEEMLRQWRLNRAGDPDFVLPINPMTGQDEDPSDVPDSDAGSSFSPDDFDEEAGPRLEADFPPDAKGRPSDGALSLLPRSPGLALLRSTDPDAPAEINKERLIIFIMSLLWRNPKEVARIDAEAKSHVISGVLKADYPAHRRTHEPETFDEFQAMLEQPGMSEYGAQVLRSFVLNEPIRKHLLDMNWQVVTVTDGEPILTSDVPIIRYRGLKDEDGMLMLPLSPTEFFVAFNNGGSIDMMRSIDANIRSGMFVEAMNKYVVRQKIKYVYGIDSHQMEFVAKHWVVSETPVAP